MFNDFKFCDWRYCFVGVAYYRAIASTAGAPGKLLLVLCF